MAVINEKYNSEEYHYSDGTIEDVLLDIVKKGKSLSEIEEYDYAILYHLSKERENILNWYPFKEDASLLEVGAGCGAITGMLATRVRKVVATDISKKRTLINYYRNENTSNIEYYIGNFNEMQFGEKFDYIILNGVFEYAMSFTKTAHPYKDFLKYVMMFLKENGKILIAIENRLGLKYFSGAPEDHTGMPFLGLNNYEGNEDVRTFSKSEWLELLEEVGIKNYRFYYPYPDYKFPNEIFSDEFYQGYGKDYYNFVDNCISIFNERMIISSLRKENMIGEFSNSFLIEIGTNTQSDFEKILYAKINSQRAAEYQIYTIIKESKGKRKVSKNILRGEAKGHILSMQKNECTFQNKNVTCLKGEKTSEGLMYPYITGRSLNYEFEKDILKKSKKEIVCYLQDIFEKILCDDIGSVEYATEKFCNVFGKVPEKYRELRCICPANVDCILDNIFRKGEKFLFIDNEWIFDFPIPRDFIIWRCINEICVRYDEIRRIFRECELFLAVGLNNEECEIFESWNRYFTLDYIKDNGLEKFAKPKTYISMEEILETGKMVSRMYFDFGDGFHEEQTQVQECMVKEHHFQHIFDILDLGSLKALRWDPVDNKLCKCTVTAVSGGEEVEIIPVNPTLKTEQGEIFLHKDPQYMISDIQKLDNRIILNGTITFLKEEEFVTIVKQIEREKKELEDSLYSAVKERENLYNTLQRIYATKGWRILQKIREIRKIFP